MGGFTAQAGTGSPRLQNLSVTSAAVPGETTDLPPTPDFDVYEIVAGIESCASEGSIDMLFLGVGYDLVGPARLLPSRRDVDAKT